MEKISIIIPAYNAGKTLIRCVDSILNQTFQDFCIYIVDDCSNDNTWSIMQQLERTDRRIFIFHQPNNQGSSIARNIALDAACGEWVSFIDADDTITPNFLSDLYNEALQSGKDMVLCSMRQVTENGILIRELIASQKYVTSTPEETLQKAYGEKDDLEFLLNLCCSKLLRKKLFINCKFPEHRLQEDAFITPYLIYNSDKGMAIAPNAYYIYYDNLGSISHKAQDGIRDLKRRQDLLYIYESHISLYLEHGNPLYMRSRVNYLNNVISIFRLHYKAYGKQYRIDFRQMRKVFSRHLREAKKEHNPYISWKLYFVLLLFAISPKVFLYLFK